MSEQEQPINFSEYNNLFDIVCDTNPDYYFVYNELYNKANKIFSRNDVAQADQGTPPDNLMQSLVASLYLYTDFYIDSITIDSASDLPLGTDEGGELYDVLATDPRFWVNFFQNIIDDDGNLKTNEECREFFIALDTHTDGNLNLFNHIVGCYFDGLARYDVQWVELPNNGAKPIEVFTIDEKKDFAQKCREYLHRQMSPPIASVSATTPQLDLNAMSDESPPLDLNAMDDSMDGGNTGKHKKIKKTKKKNKKLKNIKKSKKHNKTRKKKTHKKHNKTRKKKTHKKHNKRRNKKTHKKNY